MTEPTRILVVEDVASDYLLLHRQLRTQYPQAVCRQVANREELAEALAEGGWDIVLSDYNVPGLPFEVSHQALTEALPETPVILVSGSIGEEQAVEMLQQGIADFVLKDRLARLSTAIDRALREAAQERDKRAAERALRESEERHRVLFEAAHDAVFLVRNRPGEGPVVADANEVACARLGYPREELVGSAVERITPACDAGDIALALRVLDSGGGIFASRHQAADGRVFPVEISIAPVTVAGEPMALCVARDVSERVAAEQALRDSEERYRMLFESAHDAVYLARLEPDGKPGQFVEVNGLACRELGYSRQELLQMSPTAISESAASPAGWARVSRLLDEGGGVYATEHVAKDGRRIPVEISLSRIEAGGERLALAVVRNVSERAEAERQRQDLEQQLLQAQRLEAIGRLAGGVAHDFNNMLSVILGYSDAAVERLPPDDPLGEDLREIIQAARRSADLARQLLTFSRKQEIHPEPLDLGVAITGMGRLLQRLIGEDIELLIESDEALWTVFLDPSQVDQLVANLVVNSRDAMPTGGQIRIVTSNLRVDHRAPDQPGLAPGEYVELTVADTGCGMDQEVLEHLFEPFFTTKPVGVGTGLGLATVYGIVQQNHGRIEVDSEPGRGTVMRLCFPRYHAAAETPAATAERTIAWSGDERILLVEDDRSVRRLAVTVLTRLGYQIVATDDPTEALERFANQPGQFDLLITDLVMPGMNGRELAEALQRQQPELPVIFMSGYPADTLADRQALSSGIAYVQKPFTIESLGRQIRAALDGGAAA